MANREALRELQTRLASRLQAARTEGVSVAWLAVRTRGMGFLFPLAQAGEIFALANLQHVPYAQPWFRGVINIRGGLFGVVDLATFVVAGQAAGALPPSAPQASVVTLNSAMEVNCALQVDSLVGLRGADAFTSSQGAQMGAPAYFGNRLMDASAESWQEINLRALAQTPQFLNICA